MWIIILFLMGYIVYTVLSFKFVRLLLAIAITLLLISQMYCKENPPTKNFSSTEIEKEVKDVESIFSVFYNAE
jgi:hypothetical protein